MEESRIADRILRLEASQMADAAILVELARLSTRDEVHRMAVREELCGIVEGLFDRPQFSGPETHLRLQLALDRIERVFAPLLPQAEPPRT